jgi:hypothetical protein
MSAKIAASVVDEIGIEKKKLHNLIFRNQKDCLIHGVVLLHDPSIPADKLLARTEYMLPSSCNGIIAI